MVKGKIRAALKIRLIYCLNNPEQRSKGKYQLDTYADSLLVTSTNFTSTQKW